MSDREVMPSATAARGGRAWKWLAALGLVVMASIAVATAPQPGTLADPFVRTGAEGEVVHARKLDVEVTGVRAAEQLNLVYDESHLDTDGVWVVVDLIVTSNVDLVQLESTELRIDGIAYGTRGLPYPDMTFNSYGPGVPVQGSLVFELPASALEGKGLDAARVYFQASVSVQLDDVPEVIVDLTDLEVARTEIIDEPVVLGVR
jgi:hypothetical protein